MLYKVDVDKNASNTDVYRIHLLDTQHQLIGHALGEFRQYAAWYDGHPSFFLLELTITDKAHQQQGLGRYLLKAVEAFARQQGAHWIRGQFGTKAAEQTYVNTSEQTLKQFWFESGYGFKQEIYDNSIRFWKPLLDTKAHTRQRRSASLT